MEPPSELTVMFDHQIFIQQAYGGVSRYFAALAKCLPEESVKPIIVAPLFINSYIDVLPKTTLRGRRIPVARWSNAIARRIDAVAVKAITRLSRPSILHETYYERERKSPIGVPIVLTIYDMIHEMFPTSISNDATVALKKAALARADRILCISEHTRRDLIRLYPETADRAGVTPLGFDAHPLMPPPDPVRRPYLLYVGPRAGHKNFAMLLDAYAGSSRLRHDVELVCVGGGVFTPHECALLAANGLDISRVRQVAAHDEVLQTLYRGAAAFVYPSRYEGFGIPPLEAMAQQCPVVCFAVASIPEVCGAAAAYPAEISAEALRATIESVVDDDDYADRLRRLGVERLTLFSWQRCAAQTAAIYREMA